MENHNETTPKPKNTALAAFKAKSAKGFMRNRFFALVIDIVVVFSLCQLMYTWFGVPDWPRYLQMQDAVSGLAATDPLVVERMKLYQDCFIISLTIGAAYEALMLVLFRASIGKLIFGLRVEGAIEGRSFIATRLLYVVRAMVKMLSLYMLSALPFIFMCLTAFGNEDRRSGFDMFSGTKVVDVRRGKA